MEKKKAYLFLRVTDRNTSKQTIRKMVSEMEQFASSQYEVLKTLVKVGQTRYSSDACDPGLLVDIKAERADVLIIKSYRTISTEISELKQFHQMLEKEGISCISMMDNVEMSSYLQMQSVYSGLRIV